MKKQYESAFIRRGQLCLATAAGVVAFALSVSNAHAGTGDTKTGVDALVSQTGSCTNNTADGDEALYSLTAGNGDTAIGAGTLIYTSASDDTALGYAALYSDQNGGSNTAVGAYTLDYLSTGSYNTAIGASALGNLTSGTSNIAIGAGAGGGVTTGNNDIYIGSSIGSNESNAIRIGGSGQSVYIAGISVDHTNNVCAVVLTNALGQICSATTGNIVIQGVAGVTSSGGTEVFINDNGLLGTVQSSRRFKKDIQAMDKASEEILSLKPVTFHYKNDPALIPQYGLIAEDVAKIDPGLVLRDTKGELWTVRYNQINAMLLNEFLKEHQKVEKQSKKLVSLETSAGDQGRKIASLDAALSKQESRLAAQEKLNEQLTASLKEQAALIQKVSMQLDTNKPAMRTAANDQ